MIYIHTYGIGKFGSTERKAVHDTLESANASVSVLGGVVQAFESVEDLESKGVFTFTNLQGVRADHAEWSEKTFGSSFDVGCIGALKHLSKEAIEAAENPDDLSEWADMQLLLWDAQRRAGITDNEMFDAITSKLEINKKRSWPEPKNGVPRFHKKEGF